MSDINGAVEPPPICLRCAKELRPGVRFCPSCGLRAGDQPPSPVASDRKPSASQIIRQIDRDTRAIVNVVVFYICLILTAVLGAVVFRDSPDTVDVVVVEDIAVSLLTIFWLLIFQRTVLALYSGSSLLCGWKPWLVVLLGAFPIFFGIHTFVEFVIRTFSLEGEEMTDVYAREGYGMVFVLLSIALQPAVIEELAFRGIMQTTLAKYMGRIEAVIVTSAGFAILHFSPIGFAHLFLLGMYLGWLREWSRGLYVPMLAHALHNFLCVMQEYYRFIPG